MFTYCIAWQKSFYGNQNENLTTSPAFKSEASVNMWKLIYAATNLANRALPYLMHLTYYLQMCMNSIFSYSRKEVKTSSLVFFEKHRKTGLSYGTRDEMQPIVNLSARKKKHLSNEKLSLSKKNQSHSGVFNHGFRTAIVYWALIPTSFEGKPDWHNSDAEGFAERGGRRARPKLHTKTDFPIFLPLPPSPRIFYSTRKSPRSGADFFIIHHIASCWLGSEKNEEPKLLLGRRENLWARDRYSFSLEVGSPPVFFSFASL